MIGNSNRIKFVRPLTWLVAFGYVWTGWVTAGAQAVDEDFFETKIRPLLVENCYTCHNSHDEAEAGLVLDWRDGIRATSASGTTVVPFKPEDSLLLKVVNHELEGLEMPEGGAKLSPEEIANLRRWIAQGAPDPRVEKPDPAQHVQETSWEETFERRKQWWSFQPFQRPALPESGGGIQGGSAYGATDELGYRVTENKCTVYDLWATALHLLGLDHEKLTNRYAGRDVRLTDVHGNVIHEILS